MKHILLVSFLALLMGVQAQSFQFDVGPAAEKGLNYQDYRVWDEDEEAMVYEQVDDAFWNIKVFDARIGMRFPESNGLAGTASLGSSIGWTIKDDNFYLDDGLNFQIDARLGAAYRLLNDGSIYFNGGVGYSSMALYHNVGIHSTQSYNWIISGGYEFNLLQYRFGVEVYHRSLLRRSGLYNVQQHFLSEISKTMSVNELFATGLRVYAVFEFN